MFKIEENKKIGTHLAELIDKKYSSRREFCRAYIRASGENLSHESENNMANRLSQIIKGNKSVQTYDLPYFTKLLDVSCEHILSAGEFSVPLYDRVTNYSVASSKNRNEWEDYINRDDKLVLYSDEYHKTVLDYALEFGNYDFIKFLMDNNYIWFDSRNDHNYAKTFGAGTSIERGNLQNYIGLEYKLAFEDELRFSMISLAVDNNDIKMLEELRAREHPQLYISANYLGSWIPEFENQYNERMVKHIAKSKNTEILNYFTDSFDIRDMVRYPDGSKRSHTFLFPYISTLLDYLIIENSDFVETAIKKAIEYNRQTYKKLCALILSVKNNSNNYRLMCDNWVNYCKQELKFYDNGNIVTFRAIFSKIHSNGIITNVAKVSKTPVSPVLKHLAKELNDSYNNIVNLKEHIEEI